MKSVNRLKQPDITPRMKALLNIAGKVQQGGKHVTEDDIAAAREPRGHYREIHDTVLIAAGLYVQPLRGWPQHLVRKIWISTGFMPLRLCPEDTLR